MDILTQHEIIVALIAACVTAFTGWLTYRIGRKQIAEKAKTDASMIVDARWTQLCDQQQERIDQLHTHIAEMSKIEDDLQNRVSASVTDRAQLHDQLDALETERLVEGKRVRTLEEATDKAKNRIIELEQENQGLRMLIKGLEAFGDRMAYLEAENADLREQIFSLQERIKVLEAENQALRGKAG